MEMILETVLHTQQQYNLFPTDAVVVLAISGGADSTVLLHVMARLRDQLGIHLHVATLNHGLRPEAVAEVADVQYMAEQFHIPVTTRTVDVKRLSEQHRIGIEAAGRKARYDFFADVARQSGASIIATAHHADDQAETVLMHILRGSGVQGLVGMQAKAPLPDYPSLTLIRPLLAVRRAEIENYCVAHHLHPHEDSTNADTVFLRNAIRNAILPRLRQLNPQIDRALERLADIVAVEQDYMDRQYHQTVLPHIAIEDDGLRYRVKREVFATWHPAMQRRFIMVTARHLSAEVGYTHLIAAVERIQSADVGAVAQLTNGVRLRVSYTDIVIEHDDSRLPEADYWLIEGEYAVQLPGETQCGSLVLTAMTEPQADTVARLNVPGQAHIRTRQPGERFQPLGMDGHSKKLKDWMIDRKIPQHLRDRIPLLIVGNKIAAILLAEQWVIAHSFAVDEQSLHIFYFSVRKTL